MPKRSMNHWGWGWADHFGDASQREALGQMAQAMLGLESGPVREPVAIDEIELSPPGLSIPKELRDSLTDAREERIRHTYGRSFPEIWRGFHGDFDEAPDLVATPRHEADLQALMDWASDNDVALVPRGGATSVVGGVTPDDDHRPYAGWVSVDMKRFDDIGPVDPVDRTARIGAGALGPAIEEALTNHDLTLRHYPQSFEFSSLGGWLATRAGGHFATNYTRIDDLVETIRLVTPTGIWSTADIPSTGAGPDPLNLILGSEGTLGFITSATMKVRPRPVFRSKANVHFDDLEDAVLASRRIAQAYLFPSNLRLLDKREAMFNGVVSQPAHVLLLGFESADVPVDSLLEQALEIAVDTGGQCPKGPRHTERRPTSKGDDGAAGRWRDAFFEAPYLQSRLLSVGIVADTFETSIGWSRFFDFHADLKNTLYDAMDESGGGQLTLRFTHVYPDAPPPTIPSSSPPTPAKPSTPGAECASPPPTSSPATAPPSPTTTPWDASTAPGTNASVPRSSSKPCAPSKSDSIPIISSTPASSSTSDLGLLPATRSLHNESRDIG